MAAGSPAEGPATRRGRPRSTSVDERLLAAATALLAEVGYSDLTLAAVADRAGVPRSTLYRRWNSRAELVTAIMAALRPSEFEYTGDARVDLERLMTRATHTGELLSGAWLAILVAGQTNPEIAAAAREYDEAHRAIVRTILDKAVANGEFRDDLDVEIAIDQLGGVFLYRRAANRPFPPDIARQTVRNLLDGARR